MSKEDLLMHLNEIRRQLWLGHATVMVGSGFSKNADRTTSSTPLPPDWGQLAEELIFSLYPTLDASKRKDIQQKKSVLQLAEEYEAVAKRPSLNSLLKKLIQDENLLPSSLHTELLQLPWHDVYTTNYDTLLERAAKKVINIKYDTVFSFEDLPNSETPRIIKLHGSFPPNEKHLIVSEEDYRTYPEKYSAFVNCVQQSIIETTMCLIGFSGTDPNFQRWIGWVKDNLQKSMLPIFLIGLLDLSNAERKVLESKNIITVDLSEWDDFQHNHYKAFAKFLDFLGEKPFYLNWPNTISSDFSMPKSDTKKEELLKTIKHWMDQRVKYPNWLYLSWNRRSELQTFTEQWTYSLDYLKNLPDDWDIRGLYELNWRLEKCLMPIPNNLINDYKAILEKYASIEANNSTISAFELKKIYTELCFAILRWSREELAPETWNCYENKLKKLIGSEIDAQNHLFYEQVTYALAKLDLSELDTLIQQWDCIEHPLIWKVKFASILAELGDVDKAIILWEDALNELRPHIPKSKTKDDFQLLGIEGCIIVSLSMATNFKRFSQVSLQDENKTPENEEKQKQYKDRLRELNQFECNPWDNIERFSLLLNSPRFSESNTHTYRDFERKRTTTTFHNGWSPELAPAYQFLRFLEETGIPFQVGNVNIAKKTLQNALSRIASLSPAWAFCILNRIGASDNVSCELFFSQEALFQLDATQVNGLLDTYIGQLQYILSNKKMQVSHLTDSFYKKTAMNLYEAISRLTVKASIENLQKILDLGIAIYKADISGKYYIFNNLFSK